MFINKPLDLDLNNLNEVKNSQKGFYIPKEKTNPTRTQDFTYTDISGGINNPVIYSETTQVYINNSRLI